ncbi:histidinol dehydrogenase, partial [Myxococcota bacterium]|nr:histidinol dehydrogenase [Myxococcota bacterium]
SVKLANEYAAEHLVLAVERPESLLESVENAGTVFLGHYSPVAIGDYLAGPNHVLPTGGTARFFSPLGVEDFVKRTSFVGFQPQTLRNLGQDVIRLSNLEGLPGHGASVMIRLEGADEESGGMRTKRSIEASDE